MRDLLIHLLFIHAASTLLMAGLIWFVQIVHYPLFHQADHTNFRAFAELHQRRTGWVVGPLMLVEATTAVLLAFALHHAAGQWLAWSGVGLLASIWLSTAVVQVPMHRRLAQGYDAAIVDRLVRSNWWRTIGWSARSMIALSLLATA